MSNGKDNVERELASLLGTKPVQNQISLGVVTSLSPFMVQLPGAQVVVAADGSLTVVDPTPVNATVWTDATFALNDKVLLARLPNLDAWACIGGGHAAASGDAVLVWFNTDGTMRYRIRSGGVFGVEKIRANPPEGARSVGSGGFAVSDGGGGLTEPRLIATTSVVAVASPGSRMLFVTSDGSLIVPLFHHVTSVGDQLVVYRRSPTGVWSSQIAATFTFGVNRMWSHQNGDTVYVTAERWLVGLSGLAIDVTALAYAGGVVTVTEATVVANMLPAEFIHGVYLDATNGLLHIQWGNDADGAGVAQMLAVHLGSLTVAYTRSIGLTLVLPGFLVGDGGATFFFVRDMSGSVNVQRFVAGASSYTQADEGSTGLTRVDDGVWNGSAIELLDRASSSTMQLQQRTGPGAFDTPVTVATPSRQAQAQLVPINGPALRVVYQNVAATRVFDDEVSLTAPPLDWTLLSSGCDSYDFASPPAHDFLSGTVADGDLVVVFANFTNPAPLLLGANVRGGAAYDRLDRSSDSQQIIAVFSHVYVAGESRDITFNFTSNTSHFLTYSVWRLRGAQMLVPFGNDAIAGGPGHPSSLPSINTGIGRQLVAFAGYIAPGATTIGVPDADGTPFFTALNEIAPSGTCIGQAIAVTTSTTTTSGTRVYQSEPGSLTDVMAMAFEVIPA